MHHLPTGTVTFLFTDIEGSTHLLKQLGDRRYSEILEEHRRILRAAIEAGAGREVDMEGDAFFVAFSDAKNAAQTAISAQQALTSHRWPSDASLKVRMGLHTAAPVQTESGYVGLGVHRASRISSAAHGGQILLSQTTADMIEGNLPDGAELRDLGEYSLKGMTRTEHIFQLVAPGLPAAYPPIKAERAPSLRLRRVALAASLILLIVLVAIIRANFTRSGQRIESIAVLPLENLSGDPAQEFLADGMTEELISTLGQIGSLRVISRTSVMQYKGTKKSLPQIARELRVNGVVEGSVLRSGNRIKITAQLIHGPTDRHLWSRSYERDLRDIIVLQNEVARAIAGEIRAKLTPDQRARLATARPVDPQAHESFLKGLYEFNKPRSKEELLRSISHFQAAIAKDPGHAAAHARMAIAYVILGLGFDPDVSPAEYYAKAKTAALNAVEADNLLADAHAALGWALAQQREWHAAEEAFRRAVSLNPNSSVAHITYGDFLMTLGRSAESVREIQQADALDPLDINLKAFVGTTLYWNRRYDEAIQQLNRVLEIQPDFAYAHNVRGRAYTEKAMYQKALADTRKAMALEGRPRTVSLGSLGYTYAKMGNRKESLKILEQLKARHAQGSAAAFHIATIYAALGDRDEAFVWLDKAWDQKDAFLFVLKTGPMFDPLRSDPRFPPLLKKVYGEL